MVLDSDEEREDKRSINVQGPNTMYPECSIKASNKNNNTTRNNNSGRVIRHAPLQLNIYVLGNYHNLNDSTIQTPRNANQQENTKLSPTKSEANPVQIHV